MRAIVQLVILVVFVASLLSYAPAAHASYFLPYPSFMPGSKLYRISRSIDDLKERWYWGNIAKVKYHVGLADKYLVEAKTLFEYQQYVLALDALSRSDNHVRQIASYLAAGKKEGKDMSTQEQLVNDAMREHKRVIERIIAFVPESFVWQAEKSPASALPLHKHLKESYELR